MAVASAKKLKSSMELIDKKDIRMRFKNSRDPIYIAFDYIDKQPLHMLLKDAFVDLLEAPMNFISKVVG